MSDHPKERQIPLILIAVGVVVYVLAALVHAGPDGVGATLPAVLMIGIVQTAILIGAAILVATMLSVSFGPIPSAALKFAGAALVSGLVWAFVSGSDEAPPIAFGIGPGSISLAGRF